MVYELTFLAVRKYFARENEHPERRGFIMWRRGLDLNIRLNLLREGYKCVPYSRFVPGEKKNERKRSHIFR